MDVSRLEGYYGAWMLSGYDVDRQVSQVAQATWNLALKFFGIIEGAQGGFDVDGEFIQRLESFLLHAIMHPQSLYADFYPASGVGQQNHIPQSYSPTIPDDASVTDQGEATRAKQPKFSESVANPLERVRIGESEEEGNGDREARIRIAALAALKAHIGPYSLLPYNDFN